MRALLVVTLVVGAACGAGEPVTATCQPSGTELELEAEDIAFDTDCLAVDAGVAFTVELKNRDELIAHNVAIYDGDTAVFSGPTFQGVAERAYRIDALEAGEYDFRCEVHPGNMAGVLRAV